MCMGRFNKKMTMKMKRTIQPIWGLLALVATVMLSCGKMDETYRVFLKDGEYFYPGKADSLRAHPGDGRIQLSWLRAADPSVTTATIYWNNRQDSAVMSMDDVAGSD